ncbi:MAG: DNA polymerase III subunit chi [Rhodobacteraceae bacterium]|nr:DNA polymerase III subunit chi [Paracoccaceae bacterium]
MTEIRFYHLTQSPLEQTLPGLLAKSLERGWRVVVQGADEARLAFLDTHLWTSPEDSFLPHGLEGDGTHQPIWMTVTEQNPNNAGVLMLIDGARAAPSRMQGFDLVTVFFDGADPQAVSRAREDWKAVVAAGIPAVYWAQEAGRWVQKATSGTKKDPAE